MAYKIRQFRRRDEDGVWMTLDPYSEDWRVASPDEAHAAMYGNTQQEVPTMAHAGDILYNALKVITLDRTIRAYLEQHDPMALAQALDGIRTFDEENAPGKEYVVDLYVPFSTVVPAGAAESLGDAGALAQSVFATEQLYERLVDALDGTVWERSDSGWKVEVGEA